MATLREKLFLAGAILLVGGFFIYWAYTYEEKLRSEGYKTKKIVLYVVGGLMLLVGVAGLQDMSFRSGNIPGIFFFNDLFANIVRLAF